jgi:hypothetical protein
LPAAFLCCALVPVVMAATSGQASAQPHAIGRATIEAVASLATSSGDLDDPFLVVDVATTVRVTEGLDVIVRPYARRLPGGDWDALLYQAQIRYQPAEGVRVDAGIITSPLGLGVLQLRPDLNPTVGYPFYYFARLPQFDQYSNQVQILSGGYPLGAVVSLSGTRWDARAGVTDSTPSRYRKIFARGAPDSMAQLVAGGGVTPWIGFRMGGAVATGKYRSASDADYYGLSGYEGSLTDANALVINLEAEWSYRYTRLSGEWVRDRFDTDGAAAVSRAFYVQAVQTVTPRTFAAARFTRASSPVRNATGLERRERSAADVTVGYRLTPELTLRGGYEAERRFDRPDWDHAAVASVVWARRWF